MLKFKSINFLFFTIIIVLFILQNLYNFSYYFFLFPFLIWLAITTIGSFNILWNYHVNAYNTNPEIQGKKVAITFDDGPHPVYTLKILALLKKYDTKATFFCIGNLAKLYPEIVQQVVLEGHVIGNHSYTHSNYFGFFNIAKVISEITECDVVLSGLVKKKLKLFRPPFGVTNPSIRKALKTTNHHVIGWNVRSLDTMINDPKIILKRITTKLKSGDVILLHDTNERTIVVLEQLLLFLRENRFETITVDKLFNIDAYV